MKNKKINKNTVVIIVIASLSILIAIYFLFFLDYKDKQKFIDLKKDTITFQKRLDTSPGGIKWTSEFWCSRSYNNASDGGWNCYSALSTVVDNSKANNLTNKLTAALDSSKDLFAINSNQLYSTKKENTICHIGLDKSGTLKNDTIISFTCVDAARSSWFPPR